MILHFNTSDKFFEIFILTHKEVLFIENLSFLATKLTYI